MAMSTMTACPLLLLLLLVAAGSCVDAARLPFGGGILMPTSLAEAVEKVQDDAVAPLIHALRPLLGSGGELGRRAGVACDSWRLGVEAHNVRSWKTVPASCEGYIGHYMLGSHYRRDSRVVIDEAIAYADGLTIAGNGKEIWVFDIDETSLSNLPYYAQHGFGTQMYDPTSFNAYVAEGSAPALPETLRLFNKLISIGVKPVFLTGRTENQRAITVANLGEQGYSGWMNLFLKPAGLTASAVAYKSGVRQKMQDAGYVIVGNIGDQWSDILGAPEGTRTFKLPDPIYYIG